jgi:hypothetical protein
MDVDLRIGAEDLQWGLFEALFNNLNAKLAEEEARGQQLDSAFNILTERGLVPVTLDRFDPAHFHTGHRPSLIESSPEEWPALAVMTFAAGPSPLQTADQMTATRLTASIECITHAGPYDIDAQGKIDEDGEVIVDRKIKRTAEAIHAVVAEHRYLDGYVFPDEETPTITWGEVFIRDGAGGIDADGRYFWQGVRLQYNYNKNSSIPFGFDVDQS